MKSNLITQQKKSENFKMVIYDYLVDVEHPSDAIHAFCFSDYYNPLRCT